MLTAKDELAHNIDLLGEEEILRRLDQYEDLAEACREMLDCPHHTDATHDRVMAIYARARAAIAGPPAESVTTPDTV